MLSLNLMKKSIHQQNSKPRIVILTLDFRPDFGGVQEYLYEISKRLCVDFDIHVLTSVSGTFKEKVPFERIVLKSVNPFFILKLLRQLRPDLVLVGHAHPKILIPAFLNGRFGTLIHGNDFLAAQPRWHHSIFNWLLKRSHSLIVNSETTANHLQKFGLTATDVIHPGTDPDRFKPTVSTKKDKSFTLLTIGRLVPRKGIDTIINALPNITSEFPHVIYMIGGNGPEKNNLVQLAKTLKVNQHVQFLGFVPDEDLPRVYQDADIFIMLSHEENKESIEGFGIVYLEASASGLPIIASRSGGIVEAVIDGETGILIPPKDTEACHQALLSLLRAPDKRKVLGQNGRKWVEEEMNWDKSAQKLATILEPHVN